MGGRGGSLYTEGTLCHINLVDGSVAMAGP